jgi:solute carrier family 25 protein 34/35
MPSLAVSMLEGSFAAMGAATVSNPFEVVKTRLQLQGELERRSAANRVYKGTLHGLYLIAKNEGPSALYKGYGAALAYQFVMNGIRLGLYDECKVQLSRVLPEGGVSNLAAGISMGFVGNWVASPFFMIKTRQQARANSTIAVGQQHEYRNMLDGLVKVAREKGLAGLWHGSLLAAIRTGVGSGVQLASYDFLKPVLGHHTALHASDSRLHFITSFLCSGIVAVCMNPFDVVMTRVYTADTSQYSANFASSFAKIARTEGIEGMFKGTSALWARMGPHTICTFVFLEKIRAVRKEQFPHWDEAANV